MNININEIKITRAFTILLLVFYLTLGYYLIYIFEYEIFMNMEIFRLTAISISIVSPLLIINIFFSFIIIMTTGNVKYIGNFQLKHQSLTTALSFFISFLILFLLIIVKIVFNIHKYSAFYSVLILEALLFLLTMYIFFKPLIKEIKESGKK